MVINNIKKQDNRSVQVITERESQPDQTTRTFLKIIMEHNIKKE